MDWCPQPPWGWPKSRINGASCNQQSIKKNADMQTREAEEADLARRRKLEALQKVAGLL